MGFGRFLLKTMIPGYHHIETIKNMVEEGSVIDGVKRTVHEDLCEDIPLTSQVYKQGQYEGKKDGYVEASEEYEQKLIEQAELFLQQKHIFENEKEEYEQLLEDYERVISELEAKQELTDQENNYYIQLLKYDRKLKTLTKA